MGQFSREEFLKTELGKDYLKAWEKVGQEVMQKRLNKVCEKSERKTLLSVLRNYIKGRFWRRP